ncbi:RNA-binding domain-containing protein, partial [Pilatotrama ljubarskyi]
YPAPSDSSVQLASSSTSPQPRTILKDRLYVGNLHPTVDEYTLLQLFSKFGKISKLDYLFHKSGPLKGKPRGYAFVEYASRDDAEKALLHANDKLLRGRKLVVTYANQAPLEAAGAGGLGAKSRRPVSDVGKPTTLSLLKSAGTGRSDATDAKIARMEAKLRQLESSSAAEASSAATSLPGHPSLPPKPVAAP